MMENETTNHNDDLDEMCDNDAEDDDSGASLACDSTTTVLDPATGKFARGNQAWRIREKNRQERPPPRPATTESVRDDLLQYWERMNHADFLDLLKKRSPGELAKLIVSLIPRKDDTIIERQIGMSFKEIGDKDDLKLEATAGSE